MPVKYRKLPQVSPQDSKRFWSNIDKLGPDECWPWTAGVNTHRDGYGRFWIKRVEYRTNRMAYWLHYGIDPGAEDVCHRCDNPPCCNPAHLFQGTRAVNLADMVTKGREPRGERRGDSKLTEQEVREIRKRYVHRQVGCHQIAADYGVCAMTIHKIVRRKTWRHI